MCKIGSPLLSFLLCSLCTPLQAIAQNEKYNKLVSKIIKLNKVIESDESLGGGFVIGHSYFCVSEKITDEDVSAIVEYELIPLIKEYWFDEQTKIKEWSGILREALNE